MATLKDIAKITGLSATTVSRALRGCDDVTQKTRDRVEAVARSLNYRPNQSARKLKSGRSGIVGLVVDGAPAEFEYTHFFEITKSISEAMAAWDLDLMLHISTDENPIGTYDRLIARGIIDGFVLLIPKVDDPRVDILTTRGVPFVVHGKHVEAPDYPYFSLDSKDATRRAVEHLAEHGHQVIALLNGPGNWSVSQERRDGHNEAVRAIGLCKSPDLIRHGDTSAYFGRAATLDLLHHAQPRPTAFVCCNSLVAVGVLEAVAQLGLNVPADVSVVAHDDLLPGVDTESLVPPLTVTRLSVTEAGKTLSDLMIRRLKGENSAEMRIVEHAPWIERSSVGAARRN